MSNKSDNVHRLTASRGPNSRYEIVFESRTWPKPSLAGAWRGASALGEQTAATLGDAYARVAGSFLNWFERFEDASAERKFRARSSGRKTS